MHPAYVTISFCAFQEALKQEPASTGDKYGKESIMTDRILVHASKTWQQGILAKYDPSEDGDVDDQDLAEFVKGFGK